MLALLQRLQEIDDFGQRADAGGAVESSMAIVTVEQQGAQPARKRTIDIMLR